MTEQSWPATTLVVWTLYDHPTDRPDMFVARAFDVIAGQAPIPTGHTVTAVSLEMLRAFIRQIAPDAVCLTRSPEDDPVIIESWL